MSIEGIDTRALTKHLREKGAKKGLISSKDLDEKSLVKKAKNSPGLVGRDLIKEVMCQKAYDWNKTGKYRVVAIDSGISIKVVMDEPATQCDLVSSSHETQIF